MNYTLIESGDRKIVECDPTVVCLAGERDALDLVAACGENRTDRLLIHAGNLTEDFYNLKTGVAGEILLKFTNYWIRVAAVLTPELAEEGRFGEMVRESNRGRDFRVYYDREEAVRWLLSD
jgi:PadR family transcriptional regulator AphA